MDSTASARILVVEDDPTLAEVVGRYLTREGFDVAFAADGVDGLDQAVTTLPDLVVLDLMLPQLDGLELCRRLRAVAPIPVVMLTARGAEDDRIAGLELGADDYVAKPFSPRELTARVKAVLRRATAGVPSAGEGTPAATRSLQAGPIEVDLVSHEARLDGSADRAHRQGVRPAVPPHGQSPPGLPPGGAPGVGVGLDVRRHLDGHRPRPSPAGEGRGGPLQSPSPVHGARCRLPVRPVTGHRPSSLAAAVTAGLVAAAGLAAATAVAWGLGTTGGDTVVLVGLAALGSAGAALLGAVVLHRFRRRAVRVQALIVAMASLLATVAGVAIASAAMFLSTHDLGALAVVLLASASISVAAAVQLGEEVGAGARRVAELARRMGDENRPTPPRAGPWPGPLGDPEAVPEEFAVLAEQLNELDRRLADSRQRERSLEASRRELVAWVSHDLRSPIATIRAMAEALDDRVADDPHTVARYHHQIRHDAERLSALVDDLFELSRITSGALRLDRRPVPLGDVVAEAVRGARPSATARGVVLAERVGPLPRLAVGARELVRVLANLLENAIRHTPPGGAVVVEAGTEGGDADAVILAVLDGCGGIPPADLARVFDVAFRGDAARGHDQRGGGLGLAIAKGLVEAHRGSITVANEVGGCRFTVRLPVAEGEGDGEPARDGEPAPRGEPPRKGEDQPGITLTEGAGGPHPSPARSAAR